MQNLVKSIEYVYPSQWKQIHVPDIILYKINLKQPKSNNGILCSIYRKSSNRSLWRTESQVPDVIITCDFGVTGGNHVWWILSSGVFDNYKWSPLSKTDAQEKN